MTNSKGRKKGEKIRERLDFKFIFHVTKVPSSGWEKLYVSLESIETGKTTAKTAKAVAQNGSCKWPDAIIESTRLVHETRTNTYDTKLYKFIVGMSPTRVLGEITLNLADYVTATAGVSSSFGLKNCSAGTVLHMKLQCLTTPCESEQAKENNRGEVSEDELDDSPATNSSVNLPPPTPSREHALARYNSDSSEASTPIATGAAKNPSSYDSPSPTPSASGNSFTSRLERSSKKDSPAKKLPKAGRLSLPGKVSESEETRVSSETISRLEQELDSLKQQVSEKTSSLCVKEAEVATLAGERDAKNQELESLTLEKREKEAEIASLTSDRDQKTQELEERNSALEQVRVEKNEWESRHEALKLELEDARRLSEELQQALAREREERSSQVKEWEGKNSELESCIRELNQRLEEDRGKMEEISVKNMELQTSLVEQEQTLSEVQHALSEKLETKESELKIAQERCSELEGIDPEEVAALRKEVDELEADIKELTDENIDLIFKLNVAGKELSKLSGEADQVEMAKLEEKLTKFRKDNKSSNQKAGVLEASNRELQSEKAELENRLRKSTEEIQSLKNDLKASRSMHSVDRETFSGREMRLKQSVDELQEKLSSSSGKLAKVQAELEELAAENLENKSKREVLESSLGEFEGVKSSMAYRLAELENECLSSRNLSRKLESELGEKAQELQSKAVKVTELESRLLAAEALKTDLENRARDLESREMLSTSRIVDLEVQVASAKRELSSLEARIEELESGSDALNLEKQELANTLKNEVENSRFAKEKLEGIMVELAEANAKLETEASARSLSDSKVSELGSSKQELEKNLSRVEDENLQLSERVAGLDAQLSFLTEEKMKMESEARKLQDENDEVRKRIEEVRSQSLQAKEAAEEHVSELERSVSLLEESLEKTRKGYDACMSGKKSAEAKLAESEREVEKLVMAIREAEEKLRREKVLALERHQAELQKLSEQMNAESGDKEQLTSQALIEASELRAQKLEWEDSRQQLEDRVREAEARSSELRENLEDQKQLEVELRGELEQHQTRASELQNEAEKLGGEGDELRARCQELEEALANLETGKKSVELSLDEERASLQEKAEELSKQLSEKEAMSERIQKLEKDQAASRSLEVEHRCESIKLRRQNSEMKQKMSEQENEREELRKRLEGLEADVRRRRPGGGDENGKHLPNGVLARSLSKCNVKVGTREGQELLLLRDRVKSLELELKLKLTEVESFRRKEASFVRRIEALETADGDHPVPPELNSQEMAHRELQRVQQMNVQLQEKLNRFKEASRCGSTLERVASLETELAEALESNNMYKEQLRSAFATQQNVHAAALQNLGDVDQVVSDLLGYKRKSGELEVELGEMRERYLSMSLSFAQVEAEREELVMTIRSLKNGRRPSPS